MGAKSKQVGGGAATGVGNEWMNFLSSGLSGPGGYSAGSGQATNPLDPSQNNAMAAVFKMFGKGNNPSGGMGMGNTDPANAMQSTNAFANAINSQLAGGPTTYNNPNNPAPNGMVQQLANMQFDPMQFTTPNAGRSGAYNDALSGLQGLDPSLSSIFNAAMNGAAGGNMLPGPASLDIGQFSSQGLLGDRGNVTQAITNAENTARSDAIANARERFTAMGGNSNSSSAALAEALTNARAGESLASSLAANDINYRNLDLNAYNAFNNAQLGNRNIDAYIHGNMLNAGNQAMQTGLNAALGATNQKGNILDAIMGREFNQQQLADNNQLQTNQLNLNSGLGFNQLNSQNFTNAMNAANDIFRTQGGLDMQQAGLSQNATQNMLAQLFGAYGQAAGIGIPQAQIIQQQNPFMQGLTGLSGLIPGVGQVMQGASMLGGGNPGMSMTPNIANQLSQITPNVIQTQQPFPVLKFADGGVVYGPGGPRDDMIPARLSSGEAVLNADVVNALGPDFIEKLNQMFNRTNPAQDYGNMTFSEVLNSVSRGGSNPNALSDLSATMGPITRSIYPQGYMTAPPNESRTGKLMPGANYTGISDNSLTGQLHLAHESPRVARLKQILLESSIDSPESMAAAQELGIIGSTIRRNRTKKKGER